MKKQLTFSLLLVLLISSILPLNSFSQCIPVPGGTVVGISPDPIPNGCVGEPYIQVIYFTLPAETTVTLPPFPPTTVVFDSIVINSFSNLPAGLTISCDNPSCSYSTPNAGFFYGCATISGTPTTPMTGNSVIANLTAYAPAIGAQPTTQSFGFDVDPAGSTTASFSHTSNGLTATFTNSSSANVDSWHYDYGDGNVATLPSGDVSHSYAAPGTYTVCLITDGPCANLDTICNPVTVTPAFVPPCAPDTANLSYGSIDPLPSTCVGSVYNENIQFIISDDTTISLPPLPPTNLVFDSIVINSFSNLPAGLTAECSQPNCMWVNTGSGYFAGCVNVSGTPTASNGPVYEVIVNATAYSPLMNVPISIPVSFMVEDVPVSSFSGTPAVLSISMTDASTGADSIVWDMGDGTIITNVASPNHIYASPGTYQVCQNVYNSCGTASSCNFYNVFGAPSCSPDTNMATGFSPEIMPDGCVGQAYDQTIYWSLPADTLVSIPPFPPQVIAFDSITINAIDFLPMGLSYTCGTPTCVTTVPNSGGFFGCINISGTPVGPTGPNYFIQVQATAHYLAGNSTDTSMTIPFSIFGPPTGSFSQAPSGSAITFTGSLSDGDITSWNFGDGNMSTDLSPTHNYTAIGTYNACMYFENPCFADSVCNSVVISCLAPEPLFTFSSTELTLNPVNTTVGTNTYSWTYGDGNSASGLQPVHSYTSPGDYEICLTATNACGIVTYCDSATISCTAPVAGFSEVSLDLDVTFSNLTVGGIGNTYSWDFGDMMTSSDMDPVHSYDSAGTYTVCLMVSDPCGDHQICGNVTVSCDPAIASFSTVANELEISFSNLTVGGINNSISWDFGDSQTSSDINPVHVFDLPGNYEVCLTVNDPCGGSVLCEMIEVTCPAPVAGFSFVVDEANVFFTDLSSGDVDFYNWTFGDGTTGTGSGGSHEFAADGTYEVCLTTSSICGETVHCEMVTICQSPFSGFSYSNYGLQADFTELSINSGSFKWLLGDGNISTQANPSHIYASSGTYEVCLIASNDCSRDTICMDIEVCDLPVADFGFEDLGGYGAMFSDSSDFGSSYSWDFGDGGTSGNPNPIYFYPAENNYMVCLTVSNTCGVDSICKEVFVMYVGADNELGTQFSSIYPNPTSGFLMVEFANNASDVEALNIIDIKGRKIREIELGNGVPSIEINVEDLASGLYMIEVVGEKSRDFHKLEIR